MRKSKYLLYEPLNAKTMENCGQRWERVAEGQVDAWVIECRDQTILFSHPHSSQGDSSSRLGRVGTLRYQVVALQTKGKRLLLNNVSGFDWPPKIGDQYLIGHVSTKNRWSSGNVQRIFKHAW